MVTLTINDKQVQVPEGSTILDAAKAANIEIPTLCFLKGINEIGACRMCVVEVKGARSLQAACVYPVAEGMEVYTNTPRVRNARRATLELILSNHDRECLTCIRNRNCELQALAEQLGIDELQFEGERQNLLDNFSSSIVRDRTNAYFAAAASVCVRKCSK